MNWSIDGSSSTLAAVGAEPEAPGRAKGGKRMPVISRLPALLAKERNEAHRGYVFPLESPIAPREEMQNLLFPVSKRDQQSPVFRELLHVSLRHIGSRSSDEYCIEWRKLPPP